MLINCPSNLVFKSFETMVSFCIHHPNVYNMYIWQVWQAFDRFLTGVKNNIAWNFLQFQVQEDYWFLISQIYVNIKSTCVVKFRILLESEAIYSIGDDPHSIFSNI